jgi:5'-3' exonuclease
MGIPSYFGWLVRHFEDDIISTENPFPVLHQLYVDANCAIHPAARSKPESSLEDIYEAVIRYFEYIIDIAKPAELVYLSIDGVAPTAKMKQQRIRRFKAVKEVAELNLLKAKYQVKVNVGNQKDFNMISPSTVFMTELSTRIQTFIKSHRGGKYKHLRIIFSDSSVPGEGEHKIMQEMDKYPLDRTCAIYGLDSDLIMRALAKTKRNIVLIRENTMLKDNNFDLDIEKFPQMSYFQINGLRNRIVNIMNPYTTLTELEGLKIFSMSGPGGRKSTQATETKETDPNEKSEIMLMYDQMKANNFFTTEKETANVIYDYIFISFLLGNDFVPAFPSLKIRDGGIEQLLRAYKVIIQRRQDYLVTDDFKVNVGFLTELIQVLASTEFEALKKQKIMRDRRMKYKQSHGHPKTYEEAVEQYESVEGQGKDEINVFQDKWQSRYYTYYFQMKTAEESNYTHEVMQISKDYLRALHWITQYYFEDCPDWFWFYPHEATPLLSDFTQFLTQEDKTFTKISFELNAPVNAFHQLLMILPPQSSHLLPKPFQFLMTSDESPVIYYFPKEFDLDMYAKRYKWECHPKIPMFHPLELAKYLGHIKDQLTKSELQRCELGSNIEFCVE